MLQGNGDILNSVLESKMESNFAGSKPDFLLSIIIPTYNRHDELSKLLDQLSIELLPVREHVELLISNNHSSDETESVVHQFIAKRSNVIAVRYFEQTSNIGAPSNLHFLVKQSRSVFAWALGDDDLLVHSKLSEIVDSLVSCNSDMVLVRTEGIYEWEQIPREEGNKACHRTAFKLKSAEGVDYLLAGGFLGSVILRTASWLNVLVKVESLLDTCYANWAAVLAIAIEKGDFIVIDTPCVRGNFNMRGSSQIPFFQVLILGRVRVWDTVKHSVIGEPLKVKMNHLVQAGWRQVILGNSNDVVILVDKLQAAKQTLSFLGISGIMSYGYAFIAIVFPFPKFWRMILGSNQRLKKLVR